MNKDDERLKLLDWVAEYGIEQEIKDDGMEEGLEAAVSFLRTYFDGWGEAEWIAAYFSEK